MSVDPDALAWLREHMADEPQAGNSLSALETIAEVIAYLVEVDRDAGRDDCYGAELALAISELDRETLRENGVILRKLGYVSVADMMRKLARRAKPSPKPENTPSWKRRRLKETA